MDPIQKPIAVICVCFLNYFLIQKQCFMMQSRFGFMFLSKRNEVTFSPLLDISQKKKILLLITIYRASWSCQPIWAKDMGNSVSKPTVDIFLSGGQFCIFFSKLVRDIDLILFLLLSTENLYGAELFSASGHDR